MSPAPRATIEVQVFRRQPTAPCRHLYERDCSCSAATRRVIEYAPAPAWNAKTREAVHLRRPFVGRHGQ